MPNSEFFLTAPYRKDLHANFLELGHFCCFNNENMLVVHLYLVTKGNATMLGAYPLLGRRSILQKNATDFHELPVNSGFDT